MTTPTASMPWDVTAPHVVEVRVTEQDVDFIGHTNNVSYLRWLEQAAWSHSEALGMDWAAYQRLDAACVVRRHALDYLRETNVGEALAVGTWIASNPGRTTMTRAYQVIRADDQATVMRAESQFACIRLSTRKLIRMPPEFVRAYAATAST